MGGLYFNLFDILASYKKVRETYEKGVDRLSQLWIMSHKIIATCT